MWGKYGANTCGGMLKQVHIRAGEYIAIKIVFSLSKIAI